MPHDLEGQFIGAATVGERGQVMIPVEARERLGIKPGDKLLVFCHPSGWGVAFVKFRTASDSAAWSAALGCRGGYR